MDEKTLKECIEHTDGARGGVRDNDRDAALGHLLSLYARLEAERRTMEERKDGNEVAEAH